jgi:conjugal transfer/entry exclusion protein
MKAKVAQYEKLEEELKLLRSRAFSMATPRVDDTGRRRADSFASATSAQSAMSEDEDEELQKRAKEALQRVQRLEPEVVQRID